MLLFIVQDHTKLNSIYKKYNTVSLDLKTVGYEVFVISWLLLEVIWLSVARTQPIAMEYM